MGKIFRPRRGKNSTAKAQLKTGALGPLANGEVFFELPNGGAGTGEGKIIMGDGRTAYEQLPTFIDPSKYVHKGDTENQTVSFTETSSTDNAALLKNITSGASLKNLFSPVKNLLSNLNSSVTKLNNDKAFNMYHGTGCSIQIQGDWCMLNMVQSSVNVTANEDNKNVFSLPSNVTINSNVSYYISSILLGSSWQPTDVNLYISLQGNEVNVRTSQSYSNGVICAQMMIPKDAIRSIN